MKSICGLANTKGGILEIGRNDKGAIIGVDNASELLGELPNIIRNAIGIVPSVELRSENDKKYVAVIVGASSSTVSFRGKYYLRSGSTTQELSGTELQNFIMRKQGKTWDGITIPKVEFSDLDVSALRKFREKALTSERLKKVDLDMSDEALLDSLMLVNDGQLTHAAVLLFHEKPERFIFGAYVKVGYFENDADLLYQDEIHGSLISMPDKVMETIYLKYFKGLISYEGIQRIETFPVPRPALREAILNAIVHRDYTTGIPIQIKIFRDRVIIYNDGRLPENWTVRDLMSTHRSWPYNPKIANTFFRSGFIETWGRGIERITTACKEAGKPEPLFEASGSEIKVTFYTGISDNKFVENNDKFVENNDKFVENNDKFVDKFVENDTQRTIIKMIIENPTISAKAIANSVNMTPRGVQKNIDVLKRAGLIERVGAAKGGYWVVKIGE
ncbi:MAG: winged helix-turn-helix transcriptional regulator [Synergistaceae bacterium]|nr:winged helix-turn-helix transcriptional regulator [Synergistaceae bacterium]